MWVELMARHTLNVRRARALTDAGVRHASPGKHYDLNGLFLLAEPGGSRRWVQRIVIHGKRRDLGLGAYPLVRLAEAREAAADNRKVARAGGDPRARAREPSVPTFAEAAEQVIQMHAPGWKNGGKTAKQWRATLRDYAMARIGARRVCDITSADVMSILLPIWSAKPVTAKKVRGRIGAVMKWSIAQGYRDDNPAGDAIGAALPKNVAAPRHLRALPHGEVAGALVKVRASGAYRATVLAFEFLVLTACRSGEVRLARWSEIDLENDVWEIPQERMKMKRRHRVPLSTGAKVTLAKAFKLRDDSELVFPSVTGKPLSDSTISKLVRENGIAAVPHGFRSSFRDWCGERSGAPREVAEAALAHVVGGAEGAYARSDLFERRRKLMQEWSDYLDLSKPSALSAQPADIEGLATADVHGRM